MLEAHGAVDVLINNAGHSIRRSIEHSFERFHDFERTMRLNYFGALRLTLALLPSMQKRKAGHVINISSIGVLTNAPRFSAYVASKAAMDAFARCAASEFADDGITFTTINMPLVRTADERADRDLPATADARARGGGRPDRAGRHRAARARHHAPGRVRRGGARRWRPRSRTSS